MKRALYLSLFVVLGFIFQLGVHAVIETAYIALLIENYAIFGLGLTWSTWFAIHEFFTLALAIIGMAGGAALGLYWWPKLYDEQGKLRRLPWRSQ